jgi:hypothetical protein
MFPEEAKFRQRPSQDEDWRIREPWLFLDVDAHGHGWNEFRTAQRDVREQTPFVARFELDGGDRRLTRRERVGDEAIDQRVGDWNLARNRRSTDIAKVRAEDLVKAGKRIGRRHGEQGTRFETSSSIRLCLR